MLSIRHLCMQMGGFKLNDLSFNVDQGDYFVLLGASGVGKTLLLETLAGIIPVESGSIFWGTEEFTNTRIQMRRMGLVYQDRALFPHLNVFHNILYGASNPGKSRKEMKIFARALAEDVGVGDLLHRYPDTLSGGEAQRVSLARALATTPRCLLLDEPLSALDPQARTELRALLRKIHRKGQTIIHVTHDYEEALSLATRVGIMEKGTIVQTGNPTEVFQHPSSEFVARFTGIRNVFPVTLEVSASPPPELSIAVLNNLRIQVLSDATAGPGILLIRSEDIILSSQRTESSARNCFSGSIKDIVPVRLGLEVYVDIGVEMAVLITRDSALKLNLQSGNEVWLSFKASAARFLEA
jgi:molybdate/tungstate transport system ATP-binding protein